MILKRGADHQIKPRRGGVEELEARAAEQAPIDDRRPNQVVKPGGGVNSSAPEAAAKRIEAFRVLAHEQGFGIAVTALLLQIGANGRAPIVPDKSRRAEPYAQACLLHAPTQIHVIARLVENGIKAANLAQRPFVERHVAAWNVLCLAIRQHDMRRAARGSHDRRCHQRVFRGQKVGPADASEFALQ